MKIVDYPTTKTLSATDVVLTDGTGGTKIIAASDLAYILPHLCSPKMHRTTFRGKNLGANLTAEQKNAIQAGTFDDLWIGDYWTINNVKYRIADFDYWYGKGDTPFNTHHLVIVPDSSLANAKMNTTSTTAGGYVGSSMYTADLPGAKYTINGAFGDNVLTHREYLINQVTNGYPSAGVWSDSDVELMNEPMVYGAYVNTPASSGTVTPKRYTNSQTQLALFRVAPEYINAPDGVRVGYWLRDVVSAERFARVTDYGPALDTAASLEYGIRPAFAIGVS